jgi:hypothetical protein
MRGPGIWAVVSTPVLKMTKEEGLGFMYKTSLSGHDLHFIGYSFVDDTDLIQSSEEGQHTEVLAQRMQASMDMWERGLRATGGALEPKNPFGT